MSHVLQTLLSHLPSLASCFASSLCREQNERRKGIYKLNEAKKIHHWDAVVEAMLYFSDGRIVFGDHDGSICLLGREGQVLSVVKKGHEGAVKDLKILKMNGQEDHFVSIAAPEQLIKVWLVSCDSLHLVCLSSHLRFHISFKLLLKKIFSPPPP